MLRTVVPSSLTSLQSVLVDPLSAINSILFCLLPNEDDDKENQQTKLPLIGGSGIPENRDLEQSLEGLLQGLLVEAVQFSEVPFRQFRIHIPLHIVDLEGSDGGRQIGGVIANDPQGIPHLKVRQRLLLRSGIGIQVMPESKAMVGQRLPGEMRAGIHFSGGRNIRMADKIGPRNIVFFL